MGSVINIFISNECNYLDFTSQYFYARIPPLIFKYFSAMKDFTTILRSNLLNLSFIAAFLLLSYKLYMRYGFSNTKEQSAASTTALQTIPSLATQEQQPAPTAQQTPISAPTNSRMRYSFVDVSRVGSSHTNIDPSNDLLLPDYEDEEEQETTGGGKNQRTASELIETGEYFYEQRKAEGPYFFFRHLLHFGKQDEAIDIIKSGQLCVNTCYLLPRSHNYLGLSYAGITLLSIAASYNADKVIAHILNNTNLLPQMLNLSASALFNQLPENAKNSSRAFYDSITVDLLSFTPLMLAAAYSSAKAISALLKNERIKDAANKTDYYGNIPLGVLLARPLKHSHGFSFRSSRAEAAQALITECGTDLNKALVFYPDRDMRVNEYRMIKFCQLLDTDALSLAQVFLDNGASFSQSDFLDFSISYRGREGEPLIFKKGAQLSALALKHVLKSSNLSLEGNTLAIKYNEPLTRVNRAGEAREVFDHPETRDAYKAILGTTWTLPIDLTIKIHNGLCIMFEEEKQEHKLELTHEERLAFERVTATRNAEIEK
jgi:hypothetical protein